MLISTNWLQRYFKNDLPRADEIAGVLNSHAFEVEGIEEKNDDNTLDVKVLPDRACYALCHKGIASEIGAIKHLKLKKQTIVKYKDSPKVKIEIKVSEPNLCRRYIGRVVQNVQIGIAPKWIRNFLENIGERSINGIVDVANFIMFDIGQPLHAFDADKIKGAIDVRLAKVGEKIITLDGKEVEELKKNVLEMLIEKRLILDEGRRLEIKIEDAGIRGIIEAIKKDVSEDDRTVDVVGRNEDLKKWEEDFEKNLLIRTIVDKVISPYIEVTEKEAMDYYKEHAKEFERDEEFRAFQITVGTEEEAVKLLDLIKKGEEFRELAAKHSLSPDKEDGGDLGFFMRGEMPESFEEAVLLLSSEQERYEAIFTKTSVAFLGSGGNFENHS